MWLAKYCRLGNFCDENYIAFRTYSFSSYIAPNDMKIWHNCNWTYWTKNQWPAQRIQLTKHKQPRLSLGALWVFCGGTTFRAVQCCQNGKKWFHKPPVNVLCFTLELLVQLVSILYCSRCFAHTADNSTSSLSHRHLWFASHTTYRNPFHHFRMKWQ